jgi:hypothetical protein
MHAARDTEAGKQIHDHFNLDPDTCMVLLKGDDISYEEV